MSRCVLIACWQPKRARTQSKRFEDVQAATIVADDAHNLSKYNNKHVRKQLLEEATRVAADAEVARLLDELIRAEVLVAYPNQKQNGKRKDTRQRQARHAPVAQARSEAKDTDINKWLRRSELLHAELSWRQKKAPEKGAAESTPHLAREVMLTKQPQKMYR